MQEEFYEKAVRAGKLVLLDFGAEWCSTCKVIDNLLEKVMPGLESRLLWVKVDIHRRPDLAERFRILSVPTTLIVTPQEDVVWRKSGYFQTQELEAALPNLYHI